MQYSYGAFASFGNCVLVAGGYDDEDHDIMLYKSMMGVPGTSSQPLSTLLVLTALRSFSETTWLSLAELIKTTSTLSSVECLFTRHNLFDRRLEEIGAAELISDDYLPVGAWPHILARAIKKKWYSHVFYLLREKNGEIFGQR